MMKKSKKPFAPALSAGSFAAAVMLVLFGFSHVAEAVSVRFLPLNGEVAARKIGLKDSKALTEVKDLNPTKRTKAYACTPGDAPLALVALDRERPNGKAASVEVPLASGMVAPLVLLFADPDHPSGLRAIAVEDDSAGFPWGALRFVNTTDQPLMIRCEKETQAVAESCGVTDIALEGDARNIGVQLYAEDKPDEILYSSVWEHDPHLRKVIFMVPAESPATKELTLEIIPQDKRSKD